MVKVVRSEMREGGEGRKESVENKNVADTNTILPYVIHPSTISVRKKVKMMMD